MKGDDSKIHKVLIGPLPAIPEKGENLPWKKGDLLDSLDLSSTNLKKFMNKKVEACEFPEREKLERDWLLDNFRESIKEWAPPRSESITQIPKVPQNTNPLPNFPQNLLPNENAKAQIKPSIVPPQPNPNSPEAQNKINKRIIPRGGGKSGFNQKLQELKENNKPKRNSVFSMKNSQKKLIQGIVVPTLKTKTLKTTKIILASLATPKSAQSLKPLQILNQYTITTS